MPHIVIIGAGVTGVTTAYALLERGYDVTVVERNRYPSMETSFANSGQLSASNAEVWNHWSTVLKGLKWLMRPDAPLSVNLTPNWHKYSWFAEFIANIPHYRENTIETTRLAIAARQHMLAIAEREGIDFDHVRRGILHICWDKAGFDHATMVNGLLEQGGLDRRPVTPAEIHSIEPALRGDFYGGFYTQSDSTGDIHAFVSGLAKACERKGARLIFNATVDSVAHGKPIRVTYSQAANGSGGRNDITADGVVVCAGCDSRRIARMFGDRVNIYPVKGYSISITLDDEPSRAEAPWVSILDDRAKIVSSRLGEKRLRVAGTAEFNGFNRDIRYDRIKPLIDWTLALFPRIETRSVVSWAGLRPMMPNMMPKVGRGGKPGVFYNTGHGHLGWTLCAATAQMLADTVATDLPGGD